MKNYIGNHIQPLFRIGVILIGMVMLSCAKQGLPPGGPEDRRGPIILTAEPRPDSTGVSRSVRPFFRFDEYVDRGSVEASTFISPFPEGRVRYKWRGKSVRMVFPEQLRDSMTYVITLGTGIKDMRGNPLPQAFTLAFSTGDYLDNAAISGRIYDETDLTGTQVWAYDLGINPEPDPGNVGPDYVTQADESGSYLLTHLKEGSYRIFAIKDRRRNRRWDPNEDLIGICNIDVATKQGYVVYGADCRMSLQDTTGARITSVRVLDRNHISFRFSEQVHLTNLAPQAMIRDSLDVTLPVMAIAPDPRDSLTWRAVTETQQPGGRYFLWVEGFFDNAGNPNQRDSILFEGIDLPDTVGPHLVSYTPESRAKDVPDIPTIRMVFDEEIETDSGAVALLGSVGDPLEYELAVDGLVLTVVPKDSLPGVSLNVIVNLGGIRDLFENRGADSSVSWIFSIVSRDTLGEIRGNIEDPESLAEGPIFLEARRSDETNAQWIESGNIICPGSFAMLWLFPGTYRLRVFRDEDRSGDYSYGNPYPFVFSERFAEYPDSITVRSRWETAGITITLPGRQAFIKEAEPIDTLQVIK